MITRPLVFGAAARKALATRAVPAKPFRYSGNPIGTHDGNLSLALPESLDRTTSKPSPASKSSTRQECNNRTSGPRRMNIRESSVVAGRLRMPWGHEKTMRTIQFLALACVTQFSTLAVASDAANLSRQVVPLETIESAQLAVDQQLDASQSPQTGATTTEPS